MTLALWAGKTVEGKVEIHDYAVQIKDARLPLYADIRRLRDVSRVHTAVYLQGAGRVAGVY